jgi:hypothetical protein
VILAKKAIDGKNAATVKMKDKDSGEWHNLMGKNRKGGRPFVGNRRRRGGDAGKRGKLERKLEGKMALDKGNNKNNVLKHANGNSPEIYGKMSDGFEKNLNNEQIWTIFWYISYSPNMLAMLGHKITISEPFFCLISKQGSNQFRKAINHSKVLSVLYKVAYLNFMKSRLLKSYMSLNKINPNSSFVGKGEKPIILQIILTFQKQLDWLLFRGHFGLSNGISPSGIGCFLLEMWPKEWTRY